MKLYRAILYRIRPFQGFLMIKIFSYVFFIDFLSFESRNAIAKEKIIKFSSNKGRALDFKLFNTGDKPYCRNEILGIHVYNYCYDLSIEKDSGKRSVFPCFLFSHWKETGVENYDIYCRKLFEIRSQPINEKVIWRGAETNVSRKKLLKFDDDINFDFKSIDWKKKSPESDLPLNFLTLEDQVRNSRFLIDVEGAGYSARAKLLMFCPRVLLIQEQKLREFWFEGLEPWKNFVPIDKDFSNLKQTVSKLLSEPKLEAQILNNQREFALNNLTNLAADRVWLNLMNGTSK